MTDLDTIAHNWLTSYGRATLKEVRNILANCSDDDLAIDCITEWQLNQHATDLERAFSRFRADIEHDMAVEARGDDEMYEP